MSEVKGTLLTIILALSVFGMVFAIVTGAVKEKADEVTDQIKDAGKTTQQKVAGNTISYRY